MLHGSQTSMESQSKHKKKENQQIMIENHFLQ